MVAIFVDPNKERTDDTIDYDYTSDNCYEGQAENDQYRLTSRSWRDFEYRDYCIRYTSTKDDYNVARSKRNKYQDYYSSTSEEFWGGLYKNLYDENKDKIKGLLDSLWFIKESNQLNKIEFANSIVTFVQDIPYSYILDEANCEDQEGEFEGCLEDEKYGILSPIEFLHTLYGDCDTRTVLLYTIFKELGYEPKIAISNAYAHSVLLLNVASSGNDYVYDQGRKFYFWETTAPNWPSGVLPPDMADIGNWDVALN